MERTKENIQYKSFVGHLIQRRTQIMFMHRVNLVVNQCMNFILVFNWWKLISNKANVVIHLSALW